VSGTSKVLQKNKFVSIPHQRSKLYLIYGSLLLRKQFFNSIFIVNSTHEITIMKNILIAFAAVAGLAACKKQTVTEQEITPPDPAVPVVLTQIINNTPGALGYGYPLAVFIYSGNRLDTAKVTIYYAAGGAGKTITHAFSYDGSNKLLSVKITGQECQWTDTKVSYNGNDLSSLIYSHSGQKKIEYYCSFSKGLLATTNCKYTYWDFSTNIEWDKNGNLFKKTETENSFGSIKEEITKYLKFDNKNNVTQIMPMWLYFRENAKGFGWFVPGRNNVLQRDVNGIIRNSTFEYNKYGYPSVYTYIDDNDKETYSYKYEYKEI
jgi:hypothetical protein